MAAQQPRSSLAIGRRWLSHWALVGAVALFAGSSIFSYFRIEWQADLMAEREQNVMWTITSLEIEYLKLLREFERFLPNPNAENRERARLQLELAWSRLPVILNGLDGEHLRRIEGVDALISEVRAALERVEQIFDEDASNMERYLESKELAEVLEHTRRSIHQFVIDANLRDTVQLRDSRGSMAGARRDLYLSLIGVLVSFAILVAMLLRRLRRETALLTTAGDALQRAETQTLALQDEMVERLRADEALRRSEERFKDFAETAADWFWEMGPDLRFTYLSERFEEVMGLPARDVRGVSFDQLHAGQPEDEDRWELHAEELRAHQPFEDFELRWHRPDGRLRYLSMSGRPVFNRGGAFVGYRGVTEDITEAQRLAKQLAYQASHDALTGLVNRREFEKRIQRVLGTSKAQHSNHALCYLDLDRFKVINDTCGHPAGDELLRQLAQLLSRQVRRRDTLSRLGGDEFGVLMEHCSYDQAARLAEAMRKEVSEFKFVWGDNTFTLGVSIGLVAIDERSESLATVLSAADSACYAAKAAGRNRIHRYHPDDQDLQRREGETRWADRIQHALDNEGFRLLQQPIVPLSTDAAEAPHHIEFLVRMVSGNDLIPPGAFLPAAERYDLAARLDRWVVRAALSWLAQHPEQMDEHGLYFINLSGQSLGGDKKVREFVLAEIEQSGVPADRLCFEVTETSAVANLSSALDFVQTLKSRGCQFALDDFGSGLSSFGYLKSLPVDYLKIDGMFVKNILEDPVDLAMVKSISDIGHLMGKKTVAEFVECQEVLEALAGIGVDYAQGYYLQRPLPLAEISTHSARAALAE